MSASGTPTPEDLAADLGAILRTGATLKALERCPHILALALVRAKAAGHSQHDRAVAATGLIREATIRVDDGEQSGPHSVLLALAPGFRGTLLKQRRPQVARLLGITTDHLRDYREDGLIEAVADELYAMDSAYRLRHKHREEAEREPTDTRTGVNWLERHEAYRRVWTPVASLRDDLWVLVKLLREEADWPDIADRVMNASWRYAQFSRELERFVEDYGGLWLLADIASEVKAADSLRRIDHHLPLGEADASWLRLELKRTPEQELDPFIDRLLAQKPRVDELMQTWIEWARTCACDLAEPEPERCEVHTWMQAADEFVKLIDEDWYRIADWYRASEASVHGVEVGELWHARFRGRS